MARQLEFIGSAELVLLLPVVAAGGERLETERWPLGLVQEELAALALEAAGGDAGASRAYQRLVWTLRRRRRLRQGRAQSDAERDETRANGGGGYGAL